MTYLSVFTQTFTYPSWSVDKLPSLDGKVAIVTGASAGLGKITALELARKGAHVFCAGRSAEKTQAVIDEIVKETGNPKVELLLADFMDLVSVEAASDQFLKRNLKLDILVNNAGIVQPEWHLSKQGIESGFAVNHFATVVFTLRLLPALKKAPLARIVNLSSIAHTSVTAIGYESFNDDSNHDYKRRYNETKLASMHFTLELQRRLEAAGTNNIYVNALHPGIVKTDIFEGAHKASLLDSLVVRLANAVMISPQNGALTQLYVAADPEIEEKQYRGKYFVPYATLAEPSPQAKDEKLAAQTWEWTDRILQQHFRSGWSSAV